MVSRRTRVASWIFRRDHPSRPNAMICCFFSSFKTFAMLREATYPPAAVNVLDVSSESMAAFQVFMYGRFWVFTEGYSCPCTVLVSRAGRWLILVPALVLSAIVLPICVANPVELVRDFAVGPRDFNFLAMSVSWLLSPILLIWCVTAVVTNFLKHKRESL